MDFAMLAPEINSGRMYAGPGSGPMVAAAEAWEKLAAELHSAANSYQSVVSQLTAGPWLGPASASMAAAAAPYVTWMQSTAAQAEETATQAKAAAAAYEEAFASTVPPPVIAANRSQLSTLVSTNILGQNTAAIAATEAQYAQMWAQDAAAMYGYAGSSASATALTPFAPPQQNTDPGASANQAAAVGQATSTSAGNVQNTVSSAQQAFSAVPNALQSLATAAPAAAADPPDPLSTLSNLISVFLDAPSALATLGVDTPLAPLAAVSLPFDVVGALTGFHTDEIVSGWAGVEPWPGTGTVPPTEFPAIITGPIAPAAPAVAAPPVAAGLGEANTVGALSVPPTWTVATPAVRPVAVRLPALPETSISAAAAAEAADVGSGSTFAEMALAGMAGRAMAGTLGTGGGKDGGKAPKGKRVAARATGAATTGESAATDAESEASPSKPRTVVTGVAAELREFAKLRDEGILTDDEYTEQKNRLLGR
ncbi:MAG: PPE domain-containing protein [Mycobacterium sp.]|nr:PPE domain-containing protein [Mycobacterium sp.]